MVEKYYKIGEVVEILGIESHTLRYLESTLHLKIRRNGRGERLYSEADVEMLQFIHKLKTENHLNTHAIRMALDNLEKKEEPLSPSIPLLPKQRENAHNIENLATMITTQNTKLMNQNEILLNRLENLETMLRTYEQRQEEQINRLLEFWKKQKSPQTFRWWKKENS